MASALGSSPRGPGYWLRMRRRPGLGLVGSSFTGMFRGARPSVSLSLVNCAWVSHSGTHNGISPELMQGGAPVAVFAPYGGSRLCTLTSVCLSSGLARFGRGL